MPETASRPLAVDLAGAAHELGGIGESTVRELIASGELASCKVRRRTVVKLRDIEAYLDRNRKAAQAELEAVADRRGVR
jgi:excisionase family DNA binding protein